MNTLKKTTLVLATRNSGKTEEMRKVLEKFPVNIRNLDDFGPMPPVEEDGETFEDNAVKKAVSTARMLGTPAIADDSGLIVEALQGKPGVFSARYAGPEASDEENNRKLIREMTGVENRKAEFMCVLAIAVPTGPALIYEGRCEGLILEQPRGVQGFGYDPLFFFPPLERTFAELTPEEKNLVSHRGKALAELGQEFSKVLVWLEHRQSEAPVKWL